MRKNGKTKTLTMEEIKRQYPNQWVLIEFTKLDEYLNVVRGRVVASAQTKDEIYSKLLTAEGKRIAIEYTGELPEVAYIL
ncbi:MAG: hypothetical protein ACREBD_27615 [Blastocatellia bacterium]